MIPRTSVRQSLRIGHAARQLASVSGAPGTNVRSEAATAQLLADRYPTRGRDFAFRDRADPVCWPSEQTNGPLTAEQVQRFDEQGFLIFNSLFSPEEVATFRVELEQIRHSYEKRIDTQLNGNGVVTRSFPAVTEPGSHSLRSVFAVHKWNPMCNTLCRDARLMERATQLLSDDVYIHQSRVNFQRAFDGTGFWWHSDFETWHAEDGMPSPRALSAVVLMTDNYSWNGALMVMPGSHKVFLSCAGETPDNNWESSLKEKQRTGVPSRAALEELGDRYGIRHCEAPAGSVIMFDSNLMHGSHNNVSPKSRSNAFFVYNSMGNVVAPRPFSAPTQRPEHIATRDPEWMKPLEKMAHPNYAALIGGSAGLLVIEEEAQAAAVKK